MITLARDIAKNCAKTPTLDPGSIFLKMLFFLGHIFQYGPFSVYIVVLREKKLLTLQGTPKIFRSPVAHTDDLKFGLKFKHIIYVPSQTNKPI